MKWSRWAFVLLPVLGLGELGAHFYFARRPPDEAQWRAAAPRIAAMRKPGDLIVVAPQWAEPAARMVLGDELMPLRDVARPDQSRYATALEISIVGKRSGDTLGWTELQKQSLSKFELRRLQNPQHQEILYDFVDHVNGADASAALHGATNQPCPWNDHAQAIAGGLGGHPTLPSQRFVCPGNQAICVGVTVVEDEKYLPRRCIWMHAPEQGSLEAVFHDVPLGKEIHGHSGMRMVTERMLVGTPILLEVFVNGEKVGQDEHIDGQYWKPWSIPLGAWAGKRGEVLFRVSSPNANLRHMCWEADSR